MIDNNFIEENYFKNKLLTRALDPLPFVRIRIQLLISMRIRIQLLFYADPKVFCN